MGAMEKYWKMIPKAIAKAKSAAICIHHPLMQKRIAMPLTDEIFSPKQPAIDRRISPIHQPLTHHVSKHAASPAVADRHGDGSEHRSLTAAAVMMVASFLAMTFLVRRGILRHMVTIGLGTHVMSTTMRHRLLSWRGRRGGPPVLQVDPDGDGPQV